MTKSRKAKKGEDPEEAPSPVEEPEGKSKKTSYSGLSIKEALREAEEELRRDELTKRQRL